MQRLCYNSPFQQLTNDGKELRGRVLNRVLTFVGVAILLLALAACGGNNNNSVTTPNGNTINNPKNNLKNRAYISNQFSGNLQIVDSANDTTAFFSSTNTNNNTTNQIVDLSVNIPVGISTTFLARSPNGAMTAVYDPNVVSISFVDNTTQSAVAIVPLPAWAGMDVYSPDSTKLYVPTGNANAIQVINATNAVISASYGVPSVRWIALNPAGTVILAFADNADSMWLINLAATTITSVAIPGFSRPVNAFFSSDGNTAYVLNCGNQCGGTAAPSVAQFDMTSQTIQTTVEVGGATVGLLNGNSLYVAGYAGGANGTFDSVDVASMTRSTTNSILINDGQQWKMGLNNNKLYIGAKTCNNTVTGCLSVVDLTAQAAVAPLPPRGPVTGIQSIPNRTAMYVVEGGTLNIYDTATDQLGKVQLGFRGALNDVIQIDQ